MVRPSKWRDETSQENIWENRDMPSNASNNCERVFRNKRLNIIFLSLSTILLISGIVCWIKAAEISNVQHDNAFANMDDGNTYKANESLIELKVLTATIPDEVNISFARGPGHIFIFTGNLTGDKFAINFEKYGLQREVHYHFNPRTSVNKIVRNYYVNAKWGIEELGLCSKPYPFKIGETFQVKIEVEESKFATYINGEYYFDFTAKVSNLAEVDLITFQFDAVMQKIEVLKRI